MIGVVNSKGEWIHELSKNSPLIEDGSVIYSFLKYRQKVVKSAYIVRRSFFLRSNFYNIDGSIVINLSEYKIVNAPYFKNGKSNLEIKNNAGTIYYTEINKNGSFLFDPIEKRTNPPL